MRVLRSILIVAIGSAIGFSGCTEAVDPLEEDVLVVVNGKRINAAYVRDRILLAEKSQLLSGRRRCLGPKGMNRRIPSVYARSIQEELLDQEIEKKGIKRTPVSDQKALANALRRAKLKDYTISELAALYGPLEPCFLSEYDRESRRIAFFETLNDLEPSSADLFEYYQNLSNIIRVVEATNTNARRKSAEASLKLREGMPWEEVASRYSEDKLEAAEHEAYAVEWDVFTLENCMLEPVKAALDGVSAGFVSEPLDTEEGMLIVRVNSITNGEYNCARIMIRMMDAPEIPSLDGARSELKSAKFNDVLRSLILDLREQAKMDFPHGTNFVYKIWEEPKSKQRERKRVKQPEHTEETSK